MRLVFAVILAVLTLTAASVSSYACPPGYSKCGTRSCCPL